MSVLGQALLDDDGNLIGGVDAVRDIQAEKDAAQAPAESEERFRRSMMDAAIGMAMVSPFGQFMRVNPALCGPARPGRSHLDEQHLAGTSPILTTSTPTSIWWARFSPGSATRTACRSATCAPTARWSGQTSRCRVRDDEGHVRYFMSQVIDITESVHAREALARSEEHYRLLAENSSDVVFRASADGYLGSGSHRRSRRSGLGPGEGDGSVHSGVRQPEDVPQDHATRRVQP